MAAPEPAVLETVETQRSSIKAVRNAKGDAQFEVKVYEGTETDELDRLREAVVAQYRELEREFYGVRA